MARPKVDSRLQNIESGIKTIISENQEIIDKLYKMSSYTPKISENTEAKSTE